MIIGSIADPNGTAISPIEPLSNLNLSRSSSLSWTASWHFIRFEIAGVCQTSRQTKITYLVNNLSILWLFISYHSSLHKSTQFFLFAISSWVPLKEVTLKIIQEFMRYRKNDVFIFNHETVNIWCGVLFLPTLQSFSLWSVDWSEDNLSSQTKWWIALYFIIKSISRIPQVRAVGWK